MTGFSSLGSLEAAEHFDALCNEDASPDAIIEALDWMERDQTNRALIRQMMQFKEACDTMGTALPKTEIMEALDRPDDWHIMHWIALSRTAALFVTAMLGIATLFWAMHGKGDLQTEPRHATRYATSTGETRTLRLPDGSLVALGAASAVVIDYSGKQRLAQLTDGEAFFSVAHDAQRPFAVSTGTGLVRVLGTQFNVHRSTTGVDISVVRGKVWVSTTARAASLTAGMQVSYANDTSMSAVTRIDPALVGGWRKGTLTFRSQPLQQVVADLNRYSARPILIADYPLNAEAVTGTVRVNGISDWLEGLAATGDMKLNTARDGSLILSRR